MKNILFEEKNLRRIFYASLFVAAIFLLLNVFFIYPAYIGLIEDKTADDSRRIARHLGKNVFYGGVMLRDPAHYEKEAAEITRTFDILKIKVFTSEGEVVFSTDKIDIGTVNTNSYFKQLVATGKEYSKIVKKSAKTMEGQSFGRHVVETYIPFMHEGEFLGAFEIYYDVTDTVEKLNRIIVLTTAMPLLAFGAFIIVIGGLLQKVDKHIEAVHKADSELIKYRDSLELLVQERTKELKVANVDLEHEMAEHLQATRELKESEKFLSSIFESIHDSFSIFDRDLNIIRANKGYAQLKGRSIETLTGNQCFRVLEGRQEQCESCVVMDTFKEKIPKSKQKQITQADGEKAWVEIFTYPIFGSDNEVRFVVEYTLNITQRVDADEVRHKLIKELETLSRTDPLTSMLNRRAVGEEFEREFWRARRYGSLVSLIVCDVDNFKKVNDTMGHVVGDTVLIRVAGSISHVLRKSDVAGRYGGDEFLIVLPETDSKGSVETAERLRHNAGVVPESNKEQSVTLSLGVATITDSDKEPTDLLIRADHALYSSKASGRNRTTTAQEGDSFKPHHPTAL